MPFASHRSRYLLLALLLASLGLALLTRPAHGGWSPDPVEVHATAALCPLVSVCGDASNGSIVIWQEVSASGGVLKARRLLPSGDLDPAWVSPLAVSDRDATRGALGSVSDDAGGAYVWWMENAQLLLTRVTASGSVATGWPARGRSIGSLYSAGHRPDVLADGTGGIYLAWLSAASPLPPSFPVARGQHIGPSNIAAGGWPAGGRTLATAPGDAITASFGIGASQDGGLWLAWQTTTIVDQTPGPGELRITRLTPAGLPSTGWTFDGVSLATFDGQLLWTSPWQPVPASSLVDVARDGADGAFVLANKLVDAGDGYAIASLRRVDGAGQPSPGWPPEGITISGWGMPGVGDAGANASLRVLPDHNGGALAGFPMFGSEFTATFGFEHRSASGAPLPGGASADLHGMEFAARDDGGLWMASYKPSGATGPYEADAYVAASASDPGGGYYESKPSYYSTRYGDVGIGSLPDGGAIFAWSQLIDRQGIYAVRINPAGVVTGVPPIGATRGLRAWFVRGAGVRVDLALEGSDEVQMRLLDIAGREVSRRSTASRGEALLPGTDRLPSGLYFVRARTRTQVADARLIVTR